MRFQAGQSLDCVLQGEELVPHAGGIHESQLLGGPLHFPFGPGHELVHGLAVLGRDVPGDNGVR